MSDGRFIGVDVGGTKIATAVLEDGELRSPRPGADRASAAPDALIDQLAAQIERHRGARTRARSASALPSIIEFATGRVRHTRQHAARATCRCASC